MKIQFVYYHYGHRISAKDVARHLNKDYPKYKWKSWTRKNIRRSSLVKETLQIEMDVMHSFYTEGMKDSISRKAETPVEILIDGKTPLKYCAWAQYWLRRLEDEHPLFLIQWLREHPSLKSTFKKI